MFTLARRIISNWRRDRFKARPVSFDSSCYSEAKVADLALARDMGMSLAEFRNIDTRSPKAANLLLGRMATFGIDLNKIAQLDPPVARDLRRVCTLCKSRRRCARDLALNAPPNAWEPYCANNRTFSMLYSIA